MPRRLRIEMPGGVYHVTNRGVDRMDIIRADADCHDWSRLLDRIATRYKWRVFAHVLMTNHFHLFLKTVEPNLSKGMHAVESGYASIFNKRHARSGPVYQGRFHAILIEQESHAWEVSRYVHLNPCRAKLVSRPEEYRWSTYRYFLDPRGAPAWLDWQTIFSEFGGTEAAARIAYRRFVEAGRCQAPENPLANAFKDVLLGSPDFIARYRHLVEDVSQHGQRPGRQPTIVEVMEATAGCFSVPISELQVAGRHGNLAREAAIYLCRQFVPVPLDDLREVFGGISRSAITDTARRCELRRSENSDFGRRVEQVRQQLQR